MIGAADSSIEGFSVQFSLNHGERVDFKIDTDSTNYRIDIYRLGYYGGNGATKVTTINKTLASAQVQPDPLFDPVRKLVDAGNWNVSASWDVPADAVSGIYIAKLTRLDGSRGSNMIPFIVRDDQATSDITFQTSDTTWQAYNWWGGYNLYGGIDASGHAGRASAVSYNRPIITRDGGFSSGPQDFIFSVEYPTIRWLEQNGYDVNYITGIDTEFGKGSDIYQRNLGDAGRHQGRLRQQTRRRDIVRLQGVVADAKFHALLCQRRDLRIERLAIAVLGAGQQDADAVCQRHDHDPGLRVGTQVIADIRQTARGLRDTIGEVIHDLDRRLGGSSRTAVAQHPPGRQRGQRQSVQILQKPATHRWLPENVMLVSRIMPRPNNGPSRDGWRRPTPASGRRAENPPAV